MNLSRYELFKENYAVLTEAKDSTRRAIDTSLLTARSSISAPTRAESPRHPPLLTNAGSLPQRKMRAFHWNLLQLRLLVRLPQARVRCFCVLARAITTKDKQTTRKKRRWKTKKKSIKEKTILINSPGKINVKTEKGEGCLFETGYFLLHTIFVDSSGVL